MTDKKRGLVFISCGQYNPKEIELGKDLAAMIDALTDFCGYFAQNQTSLDGLSRNIFGALRSCAGFVAVMHERGTVKTLDGTHTRASVWVEQEIAIAAFLKQAQARDLQVAVYIQRGIKREGVRDQLHLNPIEFDSEDQVLEDFKARLRDGRFNPVRLLPPKEVQLRLEFKTLSRGNGAIHRYRLQLLVTNTGTERLTEFWSELQFPKLALEEDRTAYGKVTETTTHVIYCIDRDKLGVDLYPEHPVELLSIEYYVDRNLHQDGSVLMQPVVALFGSSGMTTQRIEKPFRELQEF
jgi:hypothetical protein